MRNLEPMSFTDATMLHMPTIAEQRISFMGLDFDPLDTDDLSIELVRYVKTKQALGYVVTPNVDHMVRLDSAPQYRHLYKAATYNVCDSRILEVFARLEGKPLPVAPGADVVDTLFRHHIRPEERIVIIGGSAEIIDTLSSKMGFSNIAWHEPPMGMRHNPDAIRRAAQFVIDHNERFAFLCVGSPQQEMVAKKAVELGGGKGIALCCGASLDFLTGQTARAPLWMRKNRLEWLHRLMSQPKRLARRYLIDGPKIFKIWMKHRSTSVQA